MTATSGKSKRFQKSIRTPKINAFKEKFREKKYNSSSSCFQLRTNFESPKLLCSERVEHRFNRFLLFVGRSRNGKEEQPLRRIEGIRVQCCVRSQHLCRRKSK